MTIVGESAGGMSVALLMLSPLASGLYRNVIMQSGTAVALFSVLERSEADERARSVKIHICYFPARFSKVSESFWRPKSYFKTHEALDMQSFLFQQVLHLNKACTYATFRI